MATEDEAALDPEYLSSPPPRWTRSRVIFLSVSAVVVLLIMAWAGEVLLPFILGVVLAYVLTPAVELCERYKVPRSVAILLVYTVTLSSIYFSIAAIAPRVYAEAVQLSREAPTMAADLASKWGPSIDQQIQGFWGRRAPEPSIAPPPEGAFEVQARPDGGFGVKLGEGFDVTQEGPNRWHVRSHQEPDNEFSVSRLLTDGVNRTIKYIKGNVFEVIRVGHLIVSTLARGIFLTFMVLMVAGYIMHTRDDIIAFFRSLPPAESRKSFDALLRRMDRGLAGVVRGQLIICLVNGVLSAIGFALFGLKYWPILSIMAAVMSIVPIFGSILSTIPVVLIGLTQDFWTALSVLLWVLGIHQVEANVLNPKIIGVAAKLHPVLVVFALLLGERSFGFWGALLAVPALSLVQSVFNHFRMEALPDTPPDSLFPPPRSNRAEPRV